VFPPLLTVNVVRLRVPGEGKKSSERGKKGEQWKKRLEDVLGVDLDSCVGFLCPEAISMSLCATSPGERGASPGLAGLCVPAVPALRLAPFCR